MQPGCMAQAANALFWLVNVSYPTTRQCNSRCSLVFTLVPPSLFLLDETREHEHSLLDKNAR